MNIHKISIFSLLLSSVLLISSADGCNTDDSLGFSENQLSTCDNSYHYTGNDWLSEIKVNETTPVASIRKYRLDGDYLVYGFELMYSDHISTMEFYHCNGEDEYMYTEGTSELLLKSIEFVNQDISTPCKLSYSLETESWVQGTKVKHENNHIVYNDSSFLSEIKRFKNNKGSVLYAFVESFEDNNETAVYFYNCVGDHLSIGTAPNGYSEIESLWLK